MPAAVRGFPRRRGERSARRARPEGRTGERMTTPKIDTLKIDALLALKSEGRLLVGRDRIRLLEAVAEHGNITQAAKALGYSYKTAWDAVNAINNLLPRPAFITRAGGRSGGGAEVTEEGVRLISAFHRLEERLARISAAIAEDGLEGQDSFLFWSLGIRISTRNVFQCEVVELTVGPVDVVVRLKMSSETTILARVTHEAADDLELAVGRTVLALVKAPFVTLASAGPDPAPQDNSFIGTITRRIDADAGAAYAKSEILIDIGSGKTMTAIVPRQLADTQNLREGMVARASFDADHVVLAAD